MDHFGGPSNVLERLDKLQKVLALAKSVNCPWLPKNWLNNVKHLKKSKNILKSFEIPKHYPFSGSNMLQPGTPFLVAAAQKAAPQAAWPRSSQCPGGATHLANRSPAQFPGPLGGYLEVNSQFDVENA